MEKEAKFVSLEPGELQLSTAEGIERKELPNGQIFKAHVNAVGTIDFNDNKGPKISVEYEIDSEGEYQGQTLRKSYSTLASPRAGLTQVAIAILGTLPEVLDPTVIVGKPLQLIFQKDSFNGIEFQKCTPLPAEKGQKVPTKATPDVVLEDVTEDDVMAAFDKAVSGK